MKQIRAYACYNLNQEVRRSSSSGAAFSALAEYVLDKQGVVYGVAMSEDCYFAEFAAVTEREGLSKLRGSKYLQAKTGNIFRQVRKDLISGKPVLFSGTGCQVNGLKKFLDKDYSNLISVDIICHGAPSPALWRKYIQYQERKHGGKLKWVNFRCKDAGWTDFGMKEVLAVTAQGADKKLYISKDHDPYMQMFLRDYCLRPSCYACAAKKVKTADLTIADFWGIEEIAPEMNDGMGTSLVLLRTDKGKAVFEKISPTMKIKEALYADGVKGNPAEYKSCVRPPQRNVFFHDMNSVSFEELKKKYVDSINDPFAVNVKRKMKSMIKSLLPVKSGGGGDGKEGDAQF